MSGVKGKSGVYKRTEKHKEALRLGSHKLPRETRICACGNTFECSITSGQKFCLKECYYLDKMGRKQSQEHIDNRAEANTLPREIRHCECNCGGIFECIVTSKKRFIRGHWVKTKGARKSAAGFKKGHTSWTFVPRETRVCLCGCKETFICKKNSDQKYLPGHNARENWKDPKYRESQLKAILAGSRKNPNGHELDLDKALQDWFPGRYVLHGRVVAGKHPDFVDVKNKKIIEYNGDFWHGESFTGRTKKEEEHRRIDYFKDNGYDCLVIWTTDLYGDQDLLKQRITEFS